MYKTKFIADIGSNHNQDLTRAKTLIEKAADLNCYGVKFQLFKAEKLYEDENIQKSLKSSELPLKWLPELKKTAHARGLKFGCTPFYEEAVEELNPHVDFFKVSSFDILRDSLIQSCISKNKAVIISCGLADEDQLKHLLLKTIIDKFGMGYLSNIALLHCVSKYPTLPKETCLTRIKELWQSLFCAVNVGYSDHSANPYVMIEALSYQPFIVEFHLDLDDGQGTEYKHGHCWTPVLFQKFLSIKHIMSSASETKFNLTEEDLKQRADKKTGLRK